MVEISVAPEMGTVMEGSLKDKEISFQFFFLLSRSFRRQGVYLCAVYLHGQRPSSTATSKVSHVTVDRNLLWTKHQRVHLASSRPCGKGRSQIYRNESSCLQVQCPLTVYTPSERFRFLQLKQCTLHLLSYVVLLLARREGYDCEEGKTAHWEHLKNKSIKRRT